jgi:hypothetical protein
MSHTVESFEHKGYTVRVIVDEDGGSYNPRDNDGNLFLFLGLPHRHYRIGDEEFDPESVSVTCQDCNGTGEKPGEPSGTWKNIKGDVLPDECQPCEGTGYLNPCRDSETGRVSLARTLDYLKADSESPYVVPVGMIDHSGVSYYLGGGPHWSDSQGWDSGTCGFMVLLPARVTEHMGADFTVTEEWAQEAARVELEEYDSWARGDVYGVVITDVNGDTEDSIWGMIGYDYALSSAKELAESLGEQPAKLHDVRLTDADLDAIEAALDYLIQTPGDGYSKDVPAALDKIKAARA